MNSAKANNNRTLLRDNSANGANNGDDISNTIDERVLNIVGSDGNDFASIKRYRYLTDHVVDTGNQEPNGLHEDIKKDVLKLNNASASKFKYEKQETKDMIKKCCDMYKTLRGNSNIISIIGDMSKLINDFYIAHIAHIKSCNDGITSSNAANKTSDAKSRCIEIAKDIVEYYKQIGEISKQQIFENILKELSLLSGTLNEQQISLKLNQL